MEDFIRSCCVGLDIHQKVIVACIIYSAEGKKRADIITNHLSDVFRSVPL